MTRLACLFFGSIAVMAAASSTAQQVEPITESTIEGEALDAPIQVASFDAAILRGLDKLTGAIVEFETSQGSEQTFERLRVTVETCQQRGQEHAVFLKIFDSGLPEGLDMVFSGWMFASSPALSSLDHPRYDVWLQSCKTS